MGRHGETRARRGEEVELDRKDEVTVQEVEQWRWEKDDVDKKAQNWGSLPWAQIRHNQEHGKHHPAS